MTMDIQPLIVKKLLRDMLSKNNEKKKKIRGAGTSDN